MANEYWEGLNRSSSPIQKEVIRIQYRCAHCEKFERYFVVRFDETLRSIMKVGQYPPWEVSGNAAIEQMLGGHSDYFKKGLVCESQGYGIGAFSYYRRIVESVIDQLLDDIGELLSPDERAAYNGALDRVKDTNVAQEKIELVKDLLPAILRPDGMNPLSVLHATLSEGLHAESDEDCLEFAGTLREILLFLVNQVVVSRKTSKEFTDSMRKALDKKRKN